jgi:hypothetical protein
MIAVIGCHANIGRRTAKLEGTFAALKQPHKLGRGCSMDAGTKQLGKLPCKPAHLKLTDPNAKPYHGKLYQVPQLLLPLLKKEFERLCEIGVLCKSNNSKWAAQGFAIPKENKQIHNLSLIFAC